MARMWTEPFDCERHVDYMQTTHVGGVVPQPPLDRLIERLVYFVEVCGFTFQFHSVEQLEQALDHFKQKTHPTSAQPGIALEHYWQRWFERLPQRLYEESKRRRVVEALSRALLQWRRPST